jgi:hypothetical protein
MKVHHRSMHFDASREIAGNRGSVALFRRQRCCGRPRGWDLLQEARGKPGKFGVRSSGKPEVRSSIAVQSKETSDHTD